jgi:hypothetical protein
MYRPYRCSTSEPVIGKFIDSTEPAEEGLFVVVFIGDISSMIDDGCCLTEVTFSTTWMVLLRVRWLLERFW